MNFESKLKVTTYDFLKSFDNSVNISRSPVRGYFVRIPERIKIQRYVDTYSLISFIGEFGGWCGIFVGISFISVVSSIVEGSFRRLTSTMYKYCGWFLQFIKIVSTILVFYTMIIIVSKYASNPTGTEVTVIKPKMNLMFTICFSGRSTPRLDNNSGKRISTFLTVI